MSRTKPLVIVGSARKAGDTAKAVSLAFPNDKIVLIDLLDHDIRAYSYSHTNRTDEFLALVQLILKADSVVFATPVYWYSMSGAMKDFFDRLTDLLEIDKPSGRLLKGKDVWLLAVGTEPTLPEGFEVPFERTVRYFDMNYRGSAYFCSAPNGDGRTLAAVIAFGRNVMGQDQGA